MKRTNLVLDERILDKARVVAGTKTYSETVTLALEELIRLRTYGLVDTWVNSDVWEGKLSEMRGDSEVSD